MDQTVGTLNMEKELKQAMRKLASGVVVATTIYNGKRLAMAATSATSLSMSPPSMLLCVHENATLYPALKAGNDFCINILSNNHADVSAACGGGAVGDDKFDVGNWLQTSAGLPYLFDAASVIVCTADADFNYGTHGLFAGRVKQVITPDAGVTTPLIYMDGAYHRLSA